MDLGIDISHHKTVTDWSLVKQSGVQFIYAKATESIGYTDSMLSTFYKQCKTYKIPFGIYHFARPSNNPVEEAKFFKGVLSQYDCELIPVLDLEVATNGVDLSKWAKTFIDTVGVPMMLYSGDGFIQNNKLYLPNTKLWVARYSSNEPYRYKTSGWDKYTIWQYSQSGTVNGVVGNVDMNKCTDLSEILVKKEDDYMLKVEDANKLIQILKAMYGIVPNDEIGRIADELRIASGQQPQNNKK